MGKLSVKKCLSLLLFIVITITIKAQSEKVIKAEEFYQNNKLDSAKIYIDNAMMSKDIANFYAWMLRGYIYKSLYRENEGKKGQSPARIEALNSLKKSMELDKFNEIEENNIAAIKYLLGTMHNDIVRALDSENDTIAIELFTISQKYYKLIDSSYEANQVREIEFALALATTYNTIADKNKGDAKAAKYITLAKLQYDKVLSLDPHNVSANSNRGVLDYNQGVRILKSINDSTKSADSIQKINEGIQLLKESLPFMFQAEAPPIILFEFNKALLRDDCVEGLSDIIEFFKKNTALTIVLEGYTDNVGSPAYNRKLSLKRASAIKKYFVSRGISAKRISIKGYGEAKPIGTNETAEGKTKNRRVEIKIN